MSYVSFVMSVGCLHAPFLLRLTIAAEHYRIRPCSFFPSQPVGRVITRLANSVSDEIRYLFTELASGGDLFSFVVHRETYGPPIIESDVKLIM